LESLVTATVITPDARASAEVGAVTKAPGVHYDSQQQPPLPLSIALHILPGVVTLAIFLVMGPFVRALGHPEELGKYLFALPLGVIAVELGVLFAAGKPKNGQFSLQNVVLYRESMPIWQYLVLGVALLAWNAIIYLPVQQVTSDWLNRTVFTWVPTWFTAEGDYSTYPVEGIAAVGALFVVVGGAAGAVEELYFRGYLLPRISRFMWWSPLINTVLFSLYHLDMLGSVVAVFLGSLPLAYVAYWKKNVSLAMILHGGMNVLFMLLWFVPLLLK